jgi:hypothetical protein
MSNYQMEYKEPKKRVTKNDKKNKKQVYSQKHIRNILKQQEASSIRNKNGSIHPSGDALLPNGRIDVPRR